MHIHADVPGGRGLLPLFLVHGVTGVRDMNGALLTLRRWQREIGSNVLAGPRMVVSGPYIAGQRVPLPHVIARNAAEARQAVDSLAALRVDFIKVHNALTPEVLFAVAREARTRRMTFAGHVFPPVTPLQASDSGQRSLEHLSGFPNECRGADSARFAGALPLQRFLLGACTSAPQRDVYARIARNQTWVTPTLIVQKPVATLTPPVTHGDRVSAYYSDSLLALMGMVLPLPPNPPEAARVAGAALLEKRMALAADLARAGIPLLIGTDAPLAPALPGEGVHIEMELLVRAGLSPAAALRAATWEPARYLGATDSLGLVAAGRVADLVMLDANPLEDITSVRRIAAVVANGRLYTRAELEALRASAEVKR
jgi:imidazolonepropionase-like amidohydrolase